VDQADNATPKIKLSMSEQALQEWFKLSDRTRYNIFSETGKAVGLPAAAIEKDWWVVRTLQLVFTTELAPYTVFKGGTSLSKAWNLIDRFSEDIDLALDRRFLGFDKPMNNTQIKKLREQSFKYISEIFFPLLQTKFRNAGFNDVRIQLPETGFNDQDPLQIEVYYNSVTEQSTYIQPRVLVETGSRSLREPFTNKTFSSIAGTYFKGKNFADEAITIPSVNPERTFLEKIFLLHEEFQKPFDKIKIERKSRHLYDLEKIMDTDYATSALNDKELYSTIVQHRRSLTRIKGIDYANHTPKKVNPVPPDAIINAWAKDYKEMQENMLRQDSLPFDQLIARIMLLKKRINELQY
jgi:Nucleotidyl transferase AbiEii toxin, Type IV TA system